METIYAGLITVLFSAWVWDLKSQAVSVRHPAPAGRTNNHPVMHADPSEMASPRHPSHVVKPNPTHLSRARSSHDEVESQATTTQYAFEDSNAHVNRHNGVPVWVIE